MGKSLRRRAEKIKQKMSGGGGAVERERERERERDRRLAPPPLSLSHPSSSLASRGALGHVDWHRGARGCRPRPCWALACTWAHAAAAVAWAAPDPYHGLAVCRRRGRALPGLQSKLRATAGTCAGTPRPCAARRARLAPVRAHVLMLLPRRGMTPLHIACAHIGGRRMTPRSCSKTGSATSNPSRVGPAAPSCWHAPRPEPATLLAACAMRGLAHAGTSSNAVCVATVLAPR